MPDDSRGSYVSGPHARLASDFDRLKFKKIPSHDTVLKSLDRTALDEVQTRKLITDIIGEETRDDQVAQE